MGRTTRVLCDDISFGESPRWRQGRLWFSDFFVHAVKSIFLAGDSRTEVEIDDQASGLGWMPDGSLLIVSMIKRQVLRRWPDGRILETIGTGIPCFSCMLGGDDGRTLFMFATIASKDSGGATLVKGELLIATVDVPHAELP